MKYMFAECSFLSSLDLSNFDTTLVNKVENMFNLCRNLEYVNFIKAKLNSNIINTLVNSASSNLIINA